MIANQALKDLLLACARGGAVPGEENRIDVYAAYDRLGDIITARGGPIPDAVMIVAELNDSGFRNLIPAGK